MEAALARAGFKVGGQSGCFASLGRGPPGLRLAASALVAELCAVPVACPAHGCFVPVPSFHHLTAPSPCCCPPQITKREMTATSFYFSRLLEAKRV